MNIPACISGAALWVRKWSASVTPQQAAIVPVAITQKIASSEAVEAGPVDADREADDEQHGRRDQRAQAGREHHPGEQHRARGRGDEQAVEPALLDVAGEVDPGRGAGEARRPAAG